MVERFTREDFAHVASLLRTLSDDDLQFRAVSSNNYNVILSALDFAAATRPAEAQAVAEGWKLVPVDPTEAMCVAGCREDDILGELVDWRGPDTTTREVVANLYRTMLAASPATGGA